MTEVGQISIKAKVDTTALDSGTRKVKSRFKEMDASGTMTENSFDKIGSKIGSIGTGLAAMGTTGLIALGSLASKAPAVAGAMASIKVTTGELTRTLGEDFKEEFEDVADLYQELSNKVKENPLEAKTTGKALLGVAGTGAAVGVSGATGLSGAIGAAVGGSAATGGVVIGAAILSYLATKLGSSYAIEKAQESGKLGEEGTTSNNFGKAVVGTTAGLMIGGPLMGWMIGLKEAISSMVTSNKDPYSENRASEEKGVEFDN